jgi:alanine racemase
MEALEWRPVMSLRTRIMLMKKAPAGAPLGYSGSYITTHETLFAVLPIGFEDGLRRSLSNRGRVIVRGQYAPIIGRVSMDLTMIDVTHIPGCAVGDEVVILGRQGGCEISAEELGREMDTISYEVTCGISERVPRVYRCRGSESDLYISIA